MLPHAEAASHYLRDPKCKLADVRRVAELRALAGRCYLDLLDYPNAQQHLGGALRLGVDVKHQDPILFVQTLAALSYLYTNKQPVYAQRLVEHAITLATSCGKADPATLTWLGLLYADLTGGTWVMRVPYDITEQPQGRDGWFGAEGFLKGLPSALARVMATPEEAVARAATPRSKILADTRLGDVRVVEGECDEACKPLIRAVRGCRRIGYKWGLDKVLTVRHNFPEEWGRADLVHILDVELSTKWEV